MIRTLSVDPALRKVVRFHATPDGRFTVETVYDVQDIVDEAAAVRAIQPQGWRGTQHLVAQIPMPLHQQLRAAGIVQDPKAFKAWLNDPDHRKLRTKDGRV